jgi:hypothetical protein
MQWPATVLVFPLFPTLLWLFIKRAPSYSHGLATTDLNSGIISSRGRTHRKRITLFDTTVLNDVILMYVSLWEGNLDCRLHYGMLLDFIVSGFWNNSLLLTILTKNINSRVYCTVQFTLSRNSTKISENVSISSGCSHMQRLHQSS